MLAMILHQYPFVHARWQRLLVYAMIVSIARTHHPLGLHLGRMENCLIPAVCVFCTVAPSTVPLSIPMRLVRSHAGDSRITPVV